MTLQDALIVTLISSVMLAMGLALKPKDLWTAVTQPQLLLSILAINVLVLPICGWLIGQHLSAEMALALLLAGACGVGTTAPLFTANVRGDIALATAAVVISGFVCLATLPISLSLAGFELSGSSAALSEISQEAFVTMLLWQIFPLVLGMFIHYWKAGQAVVWSARFKLLGNATLAVLIVGITVTKGYLITTIPLLEILVISALVAATYVLPLLFKHKAWGSALMFCVSTRNLNLALLLASRVFESDRLLLGILCYSAIMYLLLAPVTMVLKKVTAPDEVFA